MKKLAGPIIVLALLLGLAAPLLVIVAAFGTKGGAFDWHTGYEVMTLQWARLASYAGVVGGLVALGLSMSSGRMRLVALIALVAPLFVLAALLMRDGKAADVPPIHDVSTDWTDPVLFSRGLQTQRGAGANPVEPDPRVPDSAGAPWGGRRVAEINAETCPGARSVPKMVEEDKVVAALEGAGVRVLGRAPFRVEGVHESTWFGAKDDIAVRIRPGQTDVRSVSRFEKVDFGANCARVTRIVQALSK